MNDIEKRAIQLYGYYKVRILGSRVWMSFNSLRQDERDMWLGLGEYVNSEIQKAIDKEDIRKKKGKVNG